jgi:pimeloyl-ACP methyl ester carboxylesterase
MCNEAVWPAQRTGLADLAESQVIDYGLLDSLPAMAELVLAKAPARFALAGHSMGGRVAMEVMRQSPERVIALALFDTACHPRPAGEAGEAEQAQRYALLKLAQDQGMRVMGWQWLQRMVQEERLTDKALVEDILAMIALKTPAHFAAQIKALLDRPDAEPVLKTIRCPTLVLCGREDRWSPLARHEEMAGLIPGSRLVAVDACGHMSTMERPDAITAAMRSWLTEALARTA